MKSAFPKGFLHPFGFGQYKELTVQQVYEGCAILPQVMIKSMFEQLIDRVEDKYELHKYYIFTDGKFVLIVPEIYTDRMSKDENAYSATENIFHELEMLESNTEALLKLLFKKLSREASVKFDLIGGKNILDLNDISFVNKYSEKTERFSISQNNLLIVNGQPTYVEWCINNVENFFHKAGFTSIARRKECKFI